MRWSWWRRQKADGAATSGVLPTPQSETIREFIYLDEVTVRSLLASIVGALESEITTTEQASRLSEMTASAGANPLLYKAEIAAKLSEERSQENQILRKSIIQSDFKHLMELTGDSRFPPAPSSNRPPRNSVTSPAEWLNCLETDGLAVASTNLTRGRLMELEIVLSADPVFHASEAAALFLDIVREDSEVFGVSDQTTMSQISAGTRMLSKVLAGLVPIRCELASHVRVSFEGQSWLVQRAEAEALRQEADSVEVEDVILTGVAESTSFWRDSRRVLFSRARFRVLCRLTGDGFQHSWDAIKLSGVLKIRDVNLGSILRGAASTIVSDSPMGAAPKPDELNQYVGIFSRYVDELSALTGVQLDLESALPLARPSNPGSNAALIVDWFRAMVEPLEEHVVERSSVSVTREELSAIRMRAILAILNEGKAAESPDGSQEPELGLFLETEVVAIYW